MAIVNVMPLQRFYYVTGNTPMMFEPGIDEHGNPHLFEFQEHQADNIVAQGWGQIVEVRKEVIVPDDPILKAAYEEKLAQVAAYEASQAPAMAESMTAFSAAPAATTQAEVTQQVQVALAAIAETKPLETSDAKPTKTSRKFKAA